jgi:hypothetical protein
MAIGGVKRWGVKRWGDCGGACLGGKEGGGSRVRAGDPRWKVSPPAVGRAVRPGGGFERRRRRALRCSPAMMP